VFQLPVSVDRDRVVPMFGPAHAMKRGRGVYVYVELCEILNRALDRWGC